MNALYLISKPFFVKDFIEWDPLGIKYILICYPIMSFVIGVNIKWENIRLIKDIII
jgi:DUF1365 family protein